jgi:hypothetical protein
VCLREVSTVTQTPAYWILPSSRMGMEYAMLSKMNVASARLMKKRLLIWDTLYLCEKSKNIYNNVNSTHTHITTNMCLYGIRVTSDW